MAIATPDGVLTAVNSALRTLLDRPADRLVGTTLFDVTHPDDLAAAHIACARINDERSHVSRHEARLLTPAAVEVPVLISTSWIPETTESAPYLIMHIEDATARRALEEHLTHQALHDSLTGLPNRTLFHDRLEHALVRSLRDATSVAVLFIDLDRFKQVNDHFSHGVGDAVLVLFAQRLLSIVRAGDTVARLGGDEFAMICETSDPHSVESIADRVRAIAAAPFHVGDHELHLGAAVGTATERNRTADELLHQADQAMYRAKAQQGDHT